MDRKRVLVGRPGLRKGIRLLPFDYVAPLAEGAWLVAYSAGRWEEWLRTVFGLVFLFRVPSSGYLLVRRALQPPSGWSVCPVSEAEAWCVFVEMVHLGQAVAPAGEAFPGRSCDPGGAGGHVSRGGGL